MELKKILLILVGGTICTKTNEKGTLSIYEGAGLRLVENFKNSDSPFADSVTIHLTDNMKILSENMSVEKWNKMINLYREKALDKGYDGIIFAHGTDSLAYSAALFSMLLADTDIPVFFVSSNKKLDSPHSNGDANFRYAVECICMGITPNVYVTYKNSSDNRMYLHLASRLRQCENYSDDFYSNGAINITGLCYKDCLKDLPQNKKSSPITIKGDWELSNSVLMIVPYVGIRYDAYDYSKFAAILHGTYHSGTVCAEKSASYENSILNAIDTILKINTPVDIYFSPSKTEGEVYDSIPLVANYRKKEIENQFDGKMTVSFLYGTTMEAMYAKLLIAYSLFNDKKQIKDFLKGEINFENI